MRFQVVPAAYVFLRRSADGVDQLLLQLRRGTGYMDGHWAAAAAGHVEAGESVLDAAVREAAEELGVAIDRADLLPLCAMHRTVAPHGPIDERVDFFFECRRWAGEPRVLEADKSADLRWFTLDALPEPVVPHELQVMTALRTGTLAPITTFGFHASSGAAAD
ncbi:NUDIX hydrolase [Blastococcus mobilis]|uniref:ADP-ribose pyrophosphatase YjhB, NUDIX family n=1 Tax=Blastococcus mobilis TaxID=1938746 RepID=A0A238VI67_9ACTN|nr:NUDIX domain-containing protein [Blastococcus mobilis]SNR34090.1 ADP-ribose pyrophosphatase YjhB, NUDIX family [Blastococcus mobilis]